MPMTPCRKPWFAHGEASTDSTGGRRCAPGSTGSPPTCASICSPNGARPIESGLAGTVEDPLTVLPRTHWLEPVPDARALPVDADPSELMILRQSIHLAFVAALQLLPPKQRRSSSRTSSAGPLPRSPKASTPPSPP